MSLGPALPSFFPESFIESYVQLTGYELVSQFYGDKRAQRSQVPLINHIREGVWLMHELDYPKDAIEAFCLHPLLQADADLAQNFEDLMFRASRGHFCSPTVIPLCLEYRNIANAGLLTAFVREGRVSVSPLAAVNQMLVADKAQNFKDFKAYHLGTHSKSVQLKAYFECWLSALKPWYGTVERLNELSVRLAELSNSAQEQAAA